jgi:CheY-like chemotaxis protein
MPKGKVILVVDDEEGIQSILMEYLREFKYLVVQAKKGKEALDILESNHVDLVISDIRMPIMDGMQLLREIKKVKKKNPLFDDYGICPRSRN